MTDLMNRGPLGLKVPKPPKAPPKQMRNKRPGNKSNERGPFVSEVLRQFAKDKECQMKSEWCNGEKATVCLCHSRRRAGAGGGQKPHDWWGYHGCSGCHENEHKLEDRELMDAIRRTQYAVFAKFRSLTP